MTEMKHDKGLLGNCRRVILVWESPKTGVEPVPEHAIVDAGDAVDLETRDAVHLVVRGTEPREDEIVARCEPGNNITIEKMGEDESNEYFLYMSTCEYQAHTYVLIISAGSLILRRESYLSVYFKSFSKDLDSYWDSYCGLKDSDKVLPKQSKIN